MHCTGGIYWWGVKYLECSHLSSFRQPSLYAESEKEGQGELRDSDRERERLIKIRGHVLMGDEIGLQVQVVANGCQGHIYF